MLRLTYRALLLISPGLILVIATLFGESARANSGPGAGAACGDGYAVWADTGDDGDNDQIGGLRWYGAGNTIEGNVHSNDDILFYYTFNNTVNGSLEFVDNFYYLGWGNNLPSPQEVDSGSPPVSYDLDNYRPGGRMAVAAEAAGRYHFIDDRLEINDNNIVLDGLYYVTDQVEITADNLSGNVTIVSEERIEIRGSSHELDAYSGGLIFYAANGGGQNLQLDGEDSRFNGVIFSEGNIDLGGSNSVYSGAVVAEEIDMTGDSLTVSFDARYCPSGPLPTGTPPPVPSPTITPTPTATPDGTPAPAAFNYYLALTALNLGQGPGEPNDRCDQAFGLVTGMPHFFLAEDAQDWYRFMLSEPADLNISLTNFAPENGQAALYYGPACGSLTFVRNNGDVGTNKSMNLGQQPAGRYFLFVSNDGQMNTDTPYRLLIEATP
jgi:hypothetical protein